MICRFIGRQDDTFIYWYDVLFHKMTRRHFYLLPHIIPVNSPPKTPGDFQKNPPYPGVLNVQFPAPIPRHGVGSPGDDGAPTPGLASLLSNNTCQTRRRDFLKCIWNRNATWDFADIQGHSTKAQKIGQILKSFNYCQLFNYCEYF